MEATTPPAPLVSPSVASTHEEGRSSSLAIAPSARAGRADVIQDARFQDIARRVIQGQSAREIATAHGVTVRHILNLRSDPRFLEIYQAVSEAIWGDHDKIIKDEKINVSLRRAALQSRSLTLLGEVMEAVQAHINDTQNMAGSKGGVKSTMLRAAVEAVREVTNINREADRGGHGAPTVQNFIVSKDVAVVIKDAMGESGVDISDLFKDAPVIDVTPTPPTTPEEPSVPES